MISPRTATKSSPRSPQLEKARAQQRRPNTAENKNKLKKKKEILLFLRPPYHKVASVTIYNTELE